MGQAIIRTAGSRSKGFRITTLGPEGEAAYRVLAALTRLAPRCSHCLTSAGCKTLDSGEATFALDAAVRPTDADKTSVDPTGARRRPSPKVFDNSAPTPSMDAELPSKKTVVTRNVPETP
jgi:hypothetical protein